MSAAKIELRAKLDAALAEVGEAEGALELLLKDLRGTRRAEKTTITEVIELAFTRLREARSNLAIVRDLADQDDAP